MAKIFEFNQGQKGTLIDSVSKKMGVNVGNSFAKTEKGIAYRALQSNAGQITYAAEDITALNFGNNPFTIAIAFKMGKWNNNGSTYNSLFGGKADVAGVTKGITAYYISAQVLTFTWGIGSLIASLPLNDFGSLYDGKFHLALLTFDGTTYKAYLDNIKETTESTIKHSIAFDNFYIGTEEYLSQRRCNSDILFFKAYNTELNSQERNALYEEFLQSSPTEKPIRGFEYPKPTDLSMERDSKVGSDLIESSLDFTSGWIGVSATINNSNTFTTTGNGGIYKSILTVGKKYKIQISGTITGGGTLSFPNIGPTMLTGSFNTVFTGTQGVNSNFYMSIASGNTVTITKLTITEVSGLVAAYNFIPNGNTLVDISGNGNNGTIVGALRTKDGMSFNGLNNYIQFKTSVLSNITLSLRFKTSSSSRQSIIAGALDGTCVFINNGVIGSGNAFLAGMATTKNTYKDGLWHSLTVIKTGASTYRFFIDGVEDSGGSDSGYRAATEFQIGVVNNSSVGVTPTLHFNGEISDIRIYNRELTQAEITAYHNSFVKPVLIESFENYAVGDDL